MHELQVGTSLGLTYKIEGNISHISQHDTECCPHLPLHDQSAADLRRRTFSSKDGFVGSVSPITLGKSHTLRHSRVVADFGPIPKPRANLAMNICHHVSTNTTD